MLGILTSKANPHLTEDDLKFVSLLKDAKIPYEILIWDEIEPEKINAKTILIRSPWDYYLKVDEFLQVLQSCAARGIKIINDVNIIKWNASKKYLLELHKKDIPIVDSLFFSKKEDLPSLHQEMRAKGWKDIIIKPVVSASAHLTFKTRADHPEFDSYAQEVLKTGEGIVQPFISSIATDGEISLIFFNTNGPMLSHTVLKIPKSEDFRVQMEFGGSTEAIRPPKELIQLGTQILQTLHHPWLYARVDIVDWKNKPRLGELEMIEPCLFFSYNDRAAQIFVDALRQLV